MRTRKRQNARACRGVQAALIRTLALLLCSLAVPGCTGRDSRESDSQNRLAEVSVRLAVVDDPAIAAAARSLTGEWQSRTGGGQFTVEELTAADLSGRALVNADAIIYPAALFGQLVHREVVIPLSDQQLADERLQWGEVFERIRRQEVVWGAATYALPFGSPVLVCYYRADLFERFNRQPPKSWSEYQQLAKFFDGRDEFGELVTSNGSDWHGTVEPLGGGWAAITLLARSSAYVSHRGHYSTLFDINTMRPLIDGPPFVRALEELVAASRLGPPDPLEFDPAAARRAFWKGRCAMALSWPTAADASGLTDFEPSDGEIAQRRAVIAVGFAELPGSRDVFNLSEQAWEIKREDEDERVPLLSIAGRMGSVVRGGEHPNGAFELLSWLSGAEWSEHVAADSEATTMFRASHRDRAGAWVEPQVSAIAAAQYAQVLEETLSRQRAVSMPRIPARQAYLEALDEAVRLAVSGEQEPADALQQAAARWREITDELGREQQRREYRTSLGL